MTQRKEPIDFTKIAVIPPQRLAAQAEEEARVQLEDAAAQLAAVEEDVEQATSYRAEQARRYAAELARRQMESLRLYEPLASQQAFHESMAPERILRGSNRGGKTVPAAVEVARACTGQDPFHKYPRENGRAFIVGKDGKHVGDVMWRKLGRAGAFKMIRDPNYGRWRAFRPWLAWDMIHIRQAKPCQPLIPPRFIKEIAWENKKAGIPAVVRLVNGWELNFFSSLGKPPQGSDVDLAWLDEEIVDEAWYPEISARLVDRDGRFMWSATPQAGTEQLYDLHERAAKCRDMEKPPTQEFFVHLLNNLHITEAQKTLFISKMSDDERTVRVDGDFALNLYRVYANYSLTVHGMEMAGDPPPHWTRYVVVDPGHRVCAVLFGAVPPPSEGNFLLLYDELYLKSCDANMFGEQMGKRSSGQNFEAFIIDGHMGRHTEMGTGRTVEEQYSDVLRKQNVVSRRTRHGFIWGSDDVKAGILAVKGALNIREDGTPTLRVVRGRLPNFDDEIRRYHFKRKGSFVTDDPDNRSKNHLMDCLRYLVMFRPRYVKQAAGNKQLSPVVRFLKDRAAKKQYGSGTPFVRLGPGTR